MGFFVSENGLKTKDLRTPNCSWIKNANDRFYSIDTGWGRYMNSSTDEIIDAVKRINLSSPGFGINDILISLVVRFNTDIRLAKLFKKVDNKEIPSLFNDNDYVKRFTQRPYTYKGLLKYNSCTVGLSSSMRVEGLLHNGLRIVGPDQLKPKVKLRFSKSDKPGYVNYALKDQMTGDEWERVYE